MLYKFSEFDADQHFIIAPEGLNRFYQKGFGGDVVASWMTKRDRLEEIDDFAGYLSGIYNLFVDKVQSDCTKIVMGFSQGGTTAYRWMHHSSVQANLLIGYATWIPEDIDLQTAKTNFSEMKLLYTYGKNDQFLNQTRIAALNSVIEKNKLDVLWEPYDGEHRIEKKQLMHIANKYIAITTS